MRADLFDHYQFTYGNISEVYELMDWWDSIPSKLELLKFAFYNMSMGYPTVPSQSINPEDLAEFIETQGRIDELLLRLKSMLTTEGRSEELTEIATTSETIITTVKSGTNWLRFNLGPGIVLLSVYFAFWLCCQWYRIHYSEQINFNGNCVKKFS